MIMYKVSIFLSAYNGEKYIKEQINSLLRQKEIDVTIVVRDDGSTDSTTLILERYKEKYPENFQIIYGENIGCERSFFKLLYEKIDADYYAFCDQDDVWDMDKCLTQIRIIENIDGPALSACNMTVCNEQLAPAGKVYSDEYIGFYVKFIQNNDVLRNFHGCTLLWNRNLQRLLQYRKPACAVAHDTWVNAIANVVGDVKIVNIPLVNYRIHGNNVSGFGLNFFEKVINRFKLYYGRKHMCRDKICKDILKAYGPYIKKEKFSVLYATANYKNNILSKMNYVIHNILKTRQFPDSLFWSICVLLGRY